MFTGLIEAAAVIKDRSTKSLVLSRPAVFADVRTGSSIAVAGVCLSVTDLTTETMQFDLLEETLTRTTLGSLAVGDAVNLERAMKFGDRFGGHMVQGHVDGVGEVWRFGDLESLEIRYPSGLCGLIVEKGSIAVDGVSLTVVSVDDESFSVALIPLTCAETTLGSLREGDCVNIEVDIVGKYMSTSCHPE